MVKEEIKAPQMNQLFKFDRMKEDEWIINEEVDDSLKFVKIYAFKKNPYRKLRDRVNFAETLYWSSALFIDNGEQIFNFDLSDSVTSFRINMP